MRRIVLLLFAVVMMAGVVIGMAPPSQRADGQTAPV